MKKNCIIILKVRANVGAIMVTVVDVVKKLSKNKEGQKLIM